MNKEEHIEKLKSLKIDRSKGGAYFESHGQMCDWADQVAPLLKQNPLHYQNFFQNAHYIKNKNFSSGKIMNHLDIMISHMNQMIIELENDLVEDHTPEPSANNTKKEKQPPVSHWYNRPIGMVGIGVLIIILGAIALWLIRDHLGVNL